jgi:adenosylcobinamide-phosphate synthase
LKREYLIASAYAFDQIVGDPEWLPHPVRMMGKLISSGEQLLRADARTENKNFVAGAVLSLGLVLVTYFSTDKIIKSGYRQSQSCGTLVEIILGSTCLAARNLEQEADSVLSALTSGDLVLARLRLARIVGRDTQALDEQEISRALIETIAESASDGFVAPMFYMLLGGVPLAMTYKAINTLDSMIGHTDSRYFYFGKLAARLDDAANFLPARLTALGLITVSHLLPETNPRIAWRVWLRDGYRHKSPNAGQPESAMAGSLQVRLGGPNTYAGEVIPAPMIAAEFQPPRSAHAKTAVSLVSLLTALTMATCFMLLARPKWKVDS